jgi:hypothetical protein
MLQSCYSRDSSARIPELAALSIPRLSAADAVCKIANMKFTKSIGMLLLALYLILHGLLGFGLPLGPAVFLIDLIALAAGIFILIGK